MTTAGGSYQTHLTVPEMAALALAGLPTTARGIRKFIDSAGWTDHPALIERRTQRGGTVTAYSIDLLPSEARLDYVSRFIDGSATDRDLERQAAAVTDDRRSGHELNIQAARLKLVSIADKFASENGLSVRASDRHFANFYNEGACDFVPDWIREQVKQLSARTIQRWRQAARSGQAQALCNDRSRNRAGSAVLDKACGGNLKTTVLGLLAKNQFLSAKHVRAFCRDQFGDTVALPDGRTVPMPPLRTFQDRICRWREENAHALLKITNPDRFKSTTRPAATGSTRADRLNECWQIDASPADVMTTDGRHSIYSAVDIYSRRQVILVSPTPRASAVGLLIRKCIVAWGVPETIKTDNGSDFTAHATKRLLASLNIEVDLCAAYSPEQKGVVERAIGTYQRDLSAMLPGFIGHSVADRKTIEGRKAFSARLGETDDSLFGVDLTAADLQSYTDRWCETVYSHAPHAGLGGATPFEMAAAYAGKIRTIDSEHALDVLLAPVAGKDGLRRVTRQGIRIDGEYYLVRSVLPGADVFCRHDPHDLGKLFVFEPDGETFLDVAVCPGLAGLDPAETIAKVKAAQADLVADQTKEIRKAARKIGPRDVVDANLRVAERDAAAVVAFPKRTETHTTPALSAAADAATPAEPTHDAATLAMHERLAAGAPEPANSNVTPIRPETKEDRFRRALDLQARIDAGDQVDPTDLLWLGGYQLGAEYRALTVLFESFGDTALRQ